MLCGQIRMLEPTMLLDPTLGPPRGEASPGLPNVGVQPRQEPRAKRGANDVGCNDGLGGPLQGLDLSDRRREYLLGHAVPAKALKEWLH